MKYQALVLIALISSAFAQPKESGECAQLLNQVRFVPKSVEEMLGIYRCDDGLGDDSYEFRAPDSVFQRTWTDVVYEDPIRGLAGTFSLKGDTVLVRLTRFVFAPKATPEVIRKWKREESQLDTSASVFLLKRVTTKFLYAKPETVICDYLLPDDPVTMAKFCTRALRHGGGPKLMRQNGKWYSEDFLLKEQ